MAGSFQPNTCLFCQHSLPCVMLRWSFCNGFVSFPDIGSWKCDSSLCWLLNFFIVFRLVGFHWFSNHIWAWPQEICPVCHADSEYPWKTACSTSRRHRDNTIPLRNHFLGAPGDNRQGFWMPDVVSTHGHLDGPMICNEAGSWSVWHCLSCHMEKGSMCTRQSTMFGALSSWLWRTFAYSS